MNEIAIQSIVEEIVYQITSSPLTYDRVPISVSARHCHLSKKDLENLFGEGYELTIRSELSQPGNFAANETVTLIGPNGSIERVRVLGPTRNTTQVEISNTDSLKLGLNPPLRESGDIAGSSPITILGPKGSIYLIEGLIIARAHIHMPPADAQAFNVKNGEYVRVAVENKRPITFENVLVRVSPNFVLEMHIDTDEANACLLGRGQKGTLIKVVDTS